MLNNWVSSVYNSCIISSLIEHTKINSKMTFASVYGSDYGETCIEIHHKKPLFTYEDNDVSKTIAEALKNVIPVCPNCHRVIHRHKLFSDAKIAALKRSIAASSKA